jgi:hypothetical protein
LPAVCLRWQATLAPCRCTRATPSLHSWASDPAEITEFEQSCLCLPSYIVVFVANAPCNGALPRAEAGKGLSQFRNIWRSKTKSRRIRSNPGNGITVSLRFGIGSGSRCPGLTTGAVLEIDPAFSTIGLFPDGVGVAEPRVSGLPRFGRHVGVLHFWLGQGGKHSSPLAPLLFTGLVWVPGGRLFGLSSTFLEFRRFELSSGPDPGGGNLHIIVNLALAQLVFGLQVQVQWGEMASLSRGEWGISMAPSVAAPLKLARVKDVATSISPKLGGRGPARVGDCFKEA